MNLCFLADGRAEHTRRWVKYFALKGHGVDLVTWNPAVLPDYAPARVHVVRKAAPSSSLFARVRNLPALLPAVRRIIRQTRPDVLHAHAAGAYAWLAMASGFRPYVVTPWGTDVLVDAKRSRWNRFATGLALRRADLVTCDAYHIQHELVGLGVRPERIRIVIFGVDLRRFGARGDGRELRQGHGLGHGLVVISTRTLTPIHDVATFVRAVPRVLEAVPDAQFVILGDGPERDGLEHLARSLGVAGAVRFVGFVDEEEMARWLRAADVYVSTSLADAGLAASTAEAMACELPVVVTDNGDNRHWVEEGTGGFLVPMGAPDAVADRVSRLLRDPGLRRRCGALNRGVIEARNNYVTEMDRVEALYEELARGPRDGARGARA